MIHVMVEMQDLQRIEAALGMVKDKSKTVLRAAVNNTAKRSVEMLVEEARKEYIMRRPAHVRKTMEIKRATTSNLTAMVTSRGRVNELYDYSVNPSSYVTTDRPKRGHKGHELRATRGKTIQYGAITRTGQFTKTKDKHKAFITEYQSGHITLAQRVPGTRRRSKRPSHPKGEEKIKNIKATSIPVMLGNENGVYGTVAPKIQEELEQQIEQQILRLLR